MKTPEGTVEFDEAAVRRAYALHERQWQRLLDEARFTVEKRLHERGIKVHHVTGRVKAIDSVLEKARRQQLKDPLSIHDLVGLRVTCLFLSDIPKVGEVLRSCFAIDWEDDKIDGYESHQFGYMSVHFVARMQKEGYQGPRYEDLIERPFEIQVRTIAMDAWATVSHYLDYKTQDAIPSELRRDFFALSGLFYVADKHFELFFQQSLRSKEQARQSVDRPASSREEIEINLDTLHAYLTKEFGDRWGPQYGEPLRIAMVPSLVTELKLANVQTIQQLEGLVRKHWDAFLAYEEKARPSGGKYNPAGVVRVILYDVAKVATRPLKGKRDPTR